MKKDEKWLYRDIYLAYNDVVLMISEGSGDNLWPEDEANGYVDYFNLEVYEEKEFDKGYLYGSLNTIGGGFMMRKKIIRDEFKSATIADVISEVFKENGPEDSFDLYSSSLPDYRVLDMV